MNFLESDIIKLRAPEPSDLDSLYIWENDTRVWQAGMTLAPFSRNVLAKYLETAHLDIFETHQLRLIIQLKEDNFRPIGAIDLFDFDPYHNRAGIGILIADDSDRKKGYASETLEIVIKYAFKLLGLHQIYCNIATDNEKSLKLFQKHGFEIVGLKKDWNRRGTNYFDEYLLQLINTD